MAYMDCMDLATPERLLNLIITHSPLTGRSNILRRHISLRSAWHLVHIRSMLKYSTYMMINIDPIPHTLDYMVPETTYYNMLLEYSQNHFIPQSNDCALQLCLFCADPSVSNLLYWIIHYCWWEKWHIFHLEDVSFSPPTLIFKVYLFLFVASLLLFLSPSPICYLKSSGHMRMVLANERCLNSYCLSSCGNGLHQWEMLHPLSRVTQA